MQISTFNNNDFEQELEENLATYTTITPDHLNANLFSTRKEISIARYALSSQALAYKAAMEILLQLLEQQRTIKVADDQLMRTIQTLLASIEQKSSALINSVKQVTSLLKDAVEIDVDKAALRTLLVNTPSILEQTITQLSGDPNLAQEISSSFNAKINELMIAFRFDRNTLDVNPTQHNDIREGIDPNQFHLMLNSVPTQPTQP